jgi:hypothetical protein
VIGHRTALGGDQHLVTTGLAGQRLGQQRHHVFADLEYRQRAAISDDRLELHDQHPPGGVIRGAA